MKDYSIVLETRGAEQFLVVRDIGEGCLNDYLLKMLQQNAIAGLLPLKSQNMDGRRALYYQVGNLYQLKDLIRGGSIGSREAKVIYAKLVEALGGMGEYFLDVGQCVYAVEYLYVDATLNPFLPYLPLEDYRLRGIQGAWRDFFSEMLSCFMDGRQDPFYDTLMRYLVRPHFNLEEFGRFVSDQKTGNGPVVVSVQEQLGRQEPEIPAEVQEPEKGQPGQIENLGKKGKAGLLFGFGKKKDEKPEKKEKPSKPDKPGKAERPGLSIPGQKADKPEIPLLGKKTGSAADQAAAADTGKKVERQVERQVSVQQRIEPVDTDGDRWSKTVYVHPVEEDGTLMLEKRQPYLMHGRTRIPMERLPFTVGKGSTDYVVANPTVSRLHLTIRQEGNRFYVQDEHSSNGTWLDGERLIPGQARELHDGASLRLSNEDFTFYEA